MPQINKLAKVVSTLAYASSLGVALYVCQEEIKNGNNPLKNLTFNLTLINAIGYRVLDRYIAYPKCSICLSSLSNTKKFANTAQIA